MKNPLPIIENNLIQRIGCTGDGKVKSQTQERQWGDSDVRNSRKLQSILREETKGGSALFRAQGQESWVAARTVAHDVQAVRAMGRGEQNPCWTFYLSPTERERNKEKCTEIFFFFFFFPSLLATNTLATANQKLADINLAQRSQSSQIPQKNCHHLRGGLSYLLHHDGILTTISLDPAISGLPSIHLLGFA